jgi:hypothetical protein
MKHAATATLAASLFIAILAGARPGLAADDAGNFAVKGFGLRSCSDFVAARRNPGGAYLAFRSWLNGYATAYNQISPGTYDIGGKAQLENWLAWIDRYCQANARTPFVLAATALTVVLYEQRAQVMQGKPGQAVAAANADSVRAIQQALKTRGFYKGAIDGSFGPGTRAALAAYQKAKGMSETGQLDAPTLASLLRK